MTQQQQKRIIVGISSSIAAYKAIDLCNQLNKKGYRMKAIKKAERR